MEEPIKTMILAATAVTGLSAKIIKKVHMQAKGTFEVKIVKTEGTDLEKEAGIGRMTIDKLWSGDLTGISKGAMLTSATESTGSMAYVALEKVNADFGGKMGSFYFSHNATMNKADAASGIMKIVVVKGSGTDDLAGLSGELTITIDANRAHAYVFNYNLP